jgi:hypothetical protein
MASASNASPDAISRKERSDKGVKKEPTEICGCCGEKFVGLKRHYRYTPNYGPDGGVPINKPSKCAKWAMEQGIKWEELGKQSPPKKVVQPAAEDHEAEIAAAVEALRLYAPHLLAQEKPKKKMHRLHEYAPNWDLLKAGTPIRHREEDKATGLVDEWAGVYRSPTEFVRLFETTEVVFKSLNAFRGAHLRWCIENGKTNKTKSTGNAFYEMEFCGADGDWRMFDRIRHEIPRPASA